MTGSPPPLEDAREPVDGQPSEGAPETSEVPPGDSDDLTFEQALEQQERPGYDE